LPVAKFGCEFKLRCFQNCLKLGAIKVEISLSGFLKSKTHTAKQSQLLSQTASQTAV
jgi:hypothetical protein